MKLLSRGLIVALTLVGTMAFVASPALATVANTTSVMNTRPFFTPIGNTFNSSSTFRAGRVDFSVMALDGRLVTVTCAAEASGYVPMTHTRVAITSLVFRTCLGSIGTVSAVIADATSVRPYWLHVTTSVPMDPGSWNVTLEIPAGQRISISTITLGGGRFCGITIGPQSIKAVDTNRARTIAFADPTVRFILDAGSDPGPCPDPARTITLSAIFSSTPDTVRDVFRSTGMS